MIYTENTRKAMLIAYNAHLGQLDKLGIPYIYHPIHLAEQMDTEEECIVALLHDVVEDTDITFEILEKEFSKTVIEALKLLTHNKLTKYMEYIKKLEGNPISKKVKIADLMHNSDIERMRLLPEQERKRLTKKYEEAINYLNRTRIEFYFSILPQAILIPEIPLG